MGVPEHKAFLWADWSPAPGLRLTPSVELASNRWTVTTDGRRYYRTGAYADLAARLAWTPQRGLELAVAARNLLDQNYELVDGFPEDGRGFTLSATARY